MPVPGHQSLPLSEIGDYRHIQVERAGLALGAFINGVDLSSVQPAAVYAEIADALWRHHVVFLRDQALSAEAHLALASHFGAPEKHEIFQADTRHREISILENDAERPPEINVWHTDVTYRERPSLCSVLYCEEAPVAGGDTLFLNTQAAYQALAPALKQMLLTLEAEHDILQVYTGTDLLERAGGQAYALELSRSNPPVRHPVVIEHPITGKPGLLVNATHTKRLLGMSSLESRHLMNLLCEHQQLVEFQVRFSWQPGSIAIWDNFSTQHYAAADYHPQRRRMRRITVAGHKPRAYQPSDLASAA